MAWITPVTDRTTGAWCTLADMNRIAGNIDYLATELSAHQLYSGGTISKTTYTNNDYISVGDWEDILEVLSAMIDSLALEARGEADDRNTYDNYNTVEDLTLQIYERLELLLSQANNNHYAGDSIYPEGDGSIYSAGLSV